MTNGLISDATTLLLGLLVLGFLAMAFDILFSALDRAVVDAGGVFNLIRDINHKRKMNRLPASPLYENNISPRRDIEISPLRQYDLDLSYRGVDSLPESPESIYEQSANHWERDGIELSEDRYQELEMAMQESEYNARQKHRMSDDDAAAMIGGTVSDYRRRHDS